tara:strand:- start:61 stop:657 length:597 start_codon:yes stop_codon:yes gene_type:complete
MKKIILWILVFTGFMYALIGLQKSTEQERILQKTKTQHLIDSLQNVIDSLQLQKDTIQYESIDTTVIHWPWGREEFYYFKYKNNNKSGDLLSALIFVESSNNDSAYRASEGAVGCLQIRKTMVDDINRILKRQGKDKRYTYTDRWSRDKSIQMFEIYCNYYNLTTAEEIARCWNGGPRGINNPATVRYWEKVKDKINS